jgi:hypothetical protein
MKLWQHENKCVRFIGGRSQKTVGCFTQFTILANNFLPLNVALAFLNTHGLVP